MSGYEYSRFEQLLDFPCEVEFRIIIASGVSGALAAVMSCLEELRPGSTRGTRGLPRPSSGGRYFSYTVAVQVENSAHLAEIYTAVSALPPVRHVM